MLSKHVTNKELLYYYYYYYYLHCTVTIANALIISHMIYVQTIGPPWLAVG
jgi:hypothetical protein